MPVSEGVGDRRVGLKAGEICRLPKATKGQVLVYGDDGWEVGEAGIVEGDYTSWTHKWTNDYPENQTNFDVQDMTLDENKGVITMIYLAGTYRIAIHTIEDFTQLYLGSDPKYSAWGAYKKGIVIGNANLINYGFSQSLQSYLLMSDDPFNVVKVFRGGSLLWSHDMRIEVPGSQPQYGLISLTGKYILILTYSEKLILYEGE